MRGKAVQNNIRKVIAIKAIRSFMLMMPVFVVFMQENGLNMFEVLALQSIFSVAIILLEIPSGYFSDFFGRKQSIVISALLGFFGFAVYTIAIDFWGFLLAELLLAVSVSMMSGADSAFVYDTLIEVKEENEYRKIEGRMMSLAIFSESIASIIGGLVAVISLRMPFYIQAGISLLAIPLALSLREPQRKVKNQSGNVFSELMRIVVYALHGHPQLKWLIIYSSTVSASTLTMVWFIQPYLQLVQLPITLFGFFWAGMTFFASVVSWNAHKAEHVFGRKRLFFLFGVLPAIGYICLGFVQSIWALPLFLLFFFVRGLNMPVMKDFINGFISSDVRATILSVQGLIGRVIFAVIGPIIGWMQDMYSLGTAFIIAGLLFALLSAVSLVAMKRHKML